MAPQMEVPTNMTAASRIEAPSVKISQGAPYEGAHRGAGERDDRQYRYGGGPKAVLGAHARNHEPEGSRFHDVDDQRDGEQRDLYPVGFCKRRILRWSDRSVAKGLRLVTRQQSVGRSDYAQNDQPHAHKHVRVHRHTNQAKAHVPPHPEHGQVQDDTDGYHGRTRPECEHLVPPSK